MSDHSVRAATPADVDAIQTIAEASWHAAHDDIIGAEAVDEFLAEHYDRETIAAEIDADASAYRVAEVAGEVVGFAVAVPHDGDHWRLAAIYVHPDQWGDGVGTALLNAVEDAACAADAEALELVVMADNHRARRFYEARGYAHVGDGGDAPIDVEEATYARDFD